MEWMVLAIWIYMSELGDDGNLFHVEEGRIHRELLI